MPDGFDFWKWVAFSMPKPSKRDKHVKGYVCCCKCGRTGVTLRKTENKYICNECYKKELQNERIEK